LPLPYVGNDYVTDWMPEEPSLTIQLLNKLSHFSAPAEVAGLRTEHLLREGDPADEILRAASAIDADLIVMGTHGRRGLESWILGSHAERVLRTASCPVLTVSGPVASGQDAARVRIEEILCAASASAHSPETVGYARRLADSLGAKLTVVHLVSARREDDTRGVFVTTANATEAVTLEKRITSGSLASEILRTAHERVADLIVLGNHDRGPLAHGFLGSTSSHVVREAECGVLTLRASGPAIGKDRFAGQGRAAAGLAPASPR
jgi:nucleotide-binding universal stress UspA family protein